MPMRRAWRFWPVLTKHRLGARLARIMFAAMMRRTMFALLAAASLLQADTLILRNGSRVEGSFLGGDGRSVRFLVGSQVSTYYVPDIESIRFSSNQASSYPAADGYPQAGPPAPGAPPAPSAPPAPNYPPPSNYPPTNTGNYPPAPRHVDEGYNSGPIGAPAASPNAGMQIPAGTQISIRLIDPVNSERDNLGQTYRASIDQPVLVNGQTLISRGADAVASLTDEQKSGRIEGRTILTIDLRTVTVNGRTYDVHTTGVPEASSSRGARSAKVIGGATALGAIIGAAAGGGKGAAIGAGAGAGAGTAAELSTSGQKVKVPAETQLTFTLKDPIVF